MMSLENRMDSWRVINLEKCSIYALHATEDYFLEEVINTKRAPLIIFSNLQNPSVSISYKQNLEKDVNTHEAEKLSVDIARRSTGGRSMYLDSSHSIVSIIGKIDSNGINIPGMYKKTCGHIMESIRNVTGTNLHLENKNDLMTVNGKKIGGAAQRIKKGCYVVHCYIRGKLDIDMTLKLIQIGGMGLQDYGREFLGFSSSISDETGTNSEKFQDQFKSLFLSSLTQNKFYISDLTEDEINEIKKIEMHHRDKEHIKGNGKEPSRGNCDVIAGDKLRIPCLEGRVHFT